MSRPRTKFYEVILSKTSGKHVHAMYTPLSPTFIKQNWGFQGIPIFLISDPKYRLWVLAEAVLSCTHNQCFEQKYQSISTETFQFLQLTKNQYTIWACYRNEPDYSNQPATHVLATCRHGVVGMRRTQGPNVKKLACC